MFGNFIAEKCQGTGATITLYGIDDNSLPFSAKFSDTDEVKYVIEDGDGIKKCGGTGVYNSNDTITRNDDWTWNGTTYDDSPSGNLTLSAQTHIIRVAPLTSDMDNWSNANSWSDPLDSSIIPDTNNIYYLGSSVNRFARVYAESMNISNQIIVINEIVADHLRGYANTEITTKHTLLPASGYTEVDLGLDKAKFRDLHLSNNIYVDGTVDGRDIAADGIKLDTIASNATANATDAYLLNRINHTGTQSAATIYNFHSTVNANTNVIANTAKVSANGSINTHSDVNTSGASTGDLLQYNGSNWVPYAPPVNSWARISWDGNNSFSGISAPTTLGIRSIVQSSDNNYVLDNVNSTIKVNTSGDYSIDVNFIVQIDASANTNMTTVESYIEYSTNGGSTWTRLFRNRTMNSSYEGNYVTVVINDVVYGLSVNTLIRIRVTRTTGTDTITQMGHTGAIKIVKL